LRSPPRISPPIRRPCWCRSDKALPRWHRSAREFGGQGTLKGADRFLPGQWATLKTGAPTLVGAVGVLDCELEEAIERHGTTIAIGRIVAYQQDLSAQPLISFAGKYI
jgi:flavin reductase (DIM6/NTAB) family NADH-FMN oxidoreductase RutF